MKLPEPMAKPWWVYLYQYHGPWEHNDKFLKARFGYGTSAYVPGYNNNMDYLLIPREAARWIDDDTFMATRGPGLHIRASDDFEKVWGAYYQITVKPDPEVPGGIKVAPAGFQETMGVIIQHSGNWQYPTGSKWVAIRNNLTHVLGDTYVANTYFLGNNYATMHGIPPVAREHNEDALLYRYA